MGILGIGVDVTSAQRIQKYVSKFGVRSLRKFLSDDEILLCVRGANGLDSEMKITESSTNFQNLNFERIAGFWAAKEALSKALGCGIGSKLNFAHMQICLKKSGAPKIKIKKSAQILKKKKFQNLKNKNIHLSITHDCSIAVALVVVQK